MWTPRISKGDSPKYKRLADAIAEDVAEGRLKAGEKLPPQRDLAHRLSMGVGTVTRGYEEAEKRGLILAHVGRGSFVAQPTASSERSLDGPFDLAVNIAPTAVAETVLNDAIRELSRSLTRTSHSSYVSRFGAENARKAGVSWLVKQGRLETAEWNMLVCTNGAQHGISLALFAVAKPGDTILCENLTYVGLKAIAAHRGYKLHGVEMDGEGLVPAALERAAKETGARVLYTMPTLQNPTARVMGSVRRKEIARLARQLDLQVIEDDVYSHFAHDLDISPLTSLIPERCWYIGGLSKAISPSLRAGFLVVPERTMLDRIGAAIQATTLTPPGLTFELATRLIESRAANEIVNQVNAEVVKRTSLAISMLGASISKPACASSLHVWMPMTDIDAERTAGRALRAGVSIMAPSAMPVGDKVEAGLRLGLGGVPTIAHLETSLSRVVSAQSSNDSDFDAQHV